MGNAEVGSSISLSIKIRIENALKQLSIN